MTPPPTPFPEQAVIAVLAGEPVAEAAARFHLAEPDLHRASGLYRTAGQAALAQIAEQPAWIQATLNGHPSPIVLARLGAELGKAEIDNVIDGYHFLRKNGLRLRVRPCDEATEQRLTTILDGIAGSRQISGWAYTLYEQETIKFGGPAAMDIAHTLFCADSRAILAAAVNSAHASSTLAARETSVLLICALLRAAGLDSEEQGDVWVSVAAHRDEPQLPPPERLEAARSAISRLLSADPAAHRFGENWLTRVAAFETAGQDLARLARTGQLGRGLRRVLAQHVIFAVNRAGISGAQQAVLIHLAHDVLMPSDPA